MVDSLASYIETEKTIYEKSNTNTIVEIRLNKVSSILKSIIIHLWCTKKFLILYKPRQSEQLIEILLKHLTYSPVSSDVQIFDPTAINCAKAINHLLKLQCFRDHLYLSTCESIINKCIKCLNLLIFDLIKSSKNENLVVELLSTVYEFLNPSNSTNSILILNSKNSIEAIHSKLFQIVLNYFKYIFVDNKRERESLIIIFKIINKCIIDLSCNDVKLCYRLSKLGIKFILEVKAITSKKLVSEIAIFLNIIPSFISIKNLYKITGDNWNIDSCGEISTPNEINDISRSDRDETQQMVSSVVNASSDMEESIVGLNDNENGDENEFESHINSTRKRKYKTDKNTSFQQLNDLAKVIEIAFNLFNDNSVGNNLVLDTESLNLHLFELEENKLNFFCMKYFSLSKGYHSTAWILRLGIVKVLIGFYELKLELSDLSSTSDISIVNKRQRTTELSLGISIHFSEYIQLFDTSLDFLLSLHSEESFQNGFYETIASQLLSFYLGYISSNCSQINTEKLLNSIIINKDDILKELLVCFERSEIQQKYWILFTFNIFYSVIILFNIDNTKPKEISLSNDLNKLLKYCLELLKEPSLCKLSCIFLSHFSLYHFDGKIIPTNIDKTIIHQYENTINLSEINGPSILSKESIFFWVTSVNICKNFRLHNIKLHNSLNTYDSQLFSQKVSNWLYSAMNSIPEKMKTYDIFMIAYFLSWISGNGPIEIRSTFTCQLEEFYDGAALKFSMEIQRQDELIQYIKKNKVMQPNLYHNNIQLSISEDNISINDVSKSRLKSSLSRIIERYSNNNDNGIIDWCFASKIFLMYPYSDYDELIEKILNDVRERFYSNRNDITIKLFLDRYFTTFNKLPDEYITKVKNIINISELMELSLYQINQSKELESPRDLDFDVVDSFMTSNRAMVSNEFPNYELYNYNNLKYERTFEQRATNGYLKYLLNEEGIDHALEKTLKFTAKISSKFKYIASQIVILKYITPETVKVISESTIDTLFSYLTSLLEDHLTKTNEASLFVVCRNFSLFCKRWINPKLPGIDSDGKDVHDFLSNLYQKNMMYTELILLEYFKLSLEILKYDFVLSTHFNRNLILKVVQNIFSFLSNLNKCAMGNIIESYIRFTNNKFEMYGFFVKSFKDPQATTESSATFCYFMTCISGASESLVIATICNLLELSNYHQLLEYLPYSINEIVLKNKISNTHNLFWNFKEIFFKCWASFEFPIQNFPFGLFNFESLDDFFLGTYKEITALSLAHNHNSVIPMISKITSMKEPSIVNDSIALTITLAWTQGGIKNKIFKSFEKYFSSSKLLKSSIKEQYLLIVFQLFRFCDCSSEVSISNLFVNTGDNIYKKQLFPENSETLSFLDEYELSIKPKGCIDMIKYFSDICGIENQWSVPIVYHLTSKLLLLIESSILKLETKIHLRKLKILFMLASSGFKNKNICEIITRSLVSYMDDELIMNDVAGILNCLLLKNSDTLSNISVEIIFLITCTLFNGPMSSNITNLYNTVVEFRDKFTLQKYAYIFHYALDTISGNITNKTPNLVSFVNDACEDTKNTYVLIKFLSILFDRNTQLNQTNYKKIIPNLTNDLNSKKFIQNLYNIKYNYADQLSNSLVLWIGKCLGLYYEINGESPYTEIYEYESYIINQNNRHEFNSIVKSLDIIFKMMITDLPSSSLKTRYCFETIVGVILYKKNISHEDVTSYISYDELFKPYEKFIYPMGNYMCSLSIDQVENDNLSYYRHGLEQALNGFATNIKVYNFEKWITKILFSIINELCAQSSIIILLANYICHITSFSVKCFCPLVLYFIENQPSRRGALIGNMIKDFFKEDIEEIPADAISLFIELVLLIRIGAKEGNDKFVHISRHFDYPAIYKAALKIKKNKTALMLYEDYYTIITDLIPIEEVLNETKYNNVLKKIYEGVDDKDLMFGLPIVPELNYGLDILKNNGIKWGEMMFDNAKFESSLAFHDYSQISSIKDITTGMMQIGWSGVSSILGEYSNDGFDTEDDLHDDMFYEQLWKLNQWDISPPADFTSENRCVYSMLKQIRETPYAHKEICKNSIERLIKMDIKTFKTKNETFNESVSSWMRTLSLCHIVDETTSFNEDTLIAYISHSINNPVKWYKNATVKEFENILLTRRAILEIMSNQDTNNSCFFIDATSCWKGVVNELNQYNMLMTEMELTQKAINASVYLTEIALRKFHNKYNFINRIAKFNLAKAFWIQQSDTRFPVETLKDIIRGDQSNDDYYKDRTDFFPDVNPQFSIALLAKWCDECKQETSSAIMSRYIEPVAQKLSAYRTCELIDMAETYHIMATFCDDQIRKSDEETIMEKLTQSLENLEKDIKSLTKFIHEETLKEKKRYGLQDLNRLNLRYKTQTKELAALKTGRDNYIQKAIHFYFKSIVNKPFDAIESDVDRFCSLWIENSDITIDQDELLSIPAFNFVSWNKQLSSRLLDENTVFQDILSKLITEIALAHPFHTLYLIKSLLITKEESDDEAAKSRGSAAKKIWELLSTLSNKFNVEGLSNIIDSVNTFSDNAVAVANAKLKNNKKVSIQKFPNGKWWVDTLPMLLLPSPVKSIPILKNKPYRRDDLPIIVKIDEGIIIAASGVSHPKIMKMVLLNGENQRMLLKAPDDLRQDSIMQQVFEKVNTILWRNTETRKRNLRIRTYNVLPLGPTSGLLEFVPNSMPLIDILKSLHKKDLLDINEARLKIKEVQSQSKSVRFQTYKDICKEIHPCLRVFFFNNFTSPDAWFESRQIYCHGIATTSIIGYILGIGDRHCNNILLDKSSGEPIHIDFGVAFDQGKILPIPETVPFRLTRDIVDGLGITGVNGMFSKSCEYVLKVLRINNQYICGILDVLKYDPLYSWTLSPLRKKKLQQIYYNNDDNDKGLDDFIKTDIGSEANTAIEMVKRKLEAKGLSNEAVVRELIHEATDPKNLALIFMGWSAFL